MMDKQAELDDFQQKYEEEIEKCKNLEVMWYLIITGNS